MKEVFFTLLALSIPLVILAGLLYMFGHGVLTVIGDWYERRQLAQLRQEMRLRQQGNAPEPTAATGPSPATATSGQPTADAPPETAQAVDPPTPEA